MTASVCECPLCQATFQATPEMAGSTVQCPGCARFLQLPVRIGSSTPQICQAIRIDVCDCPQCGKGFGYTTQMLGSVVACPHCGSSFQLNATGRLGKEVGAAGNETTAPADVKTAPSPPPPAPAKVKKQRFRENENDVSAPREKPARESAATGSGMFEPPRIETAKPPRKDLPDVEFRIELTKPSVTSEQPPHVAPTRKPSLPGADLNLPGTEPGKARPSALPSGPAVEIPRPPSPSARTTQGAEPTLPPVIGIESGRGISSPPTFSEMDTNRGRDVIGTLDAKAADAAQLLPPRFYSSDPTIIRQPKNRSEAAFVLLPDAAGGFQRVNNTVIRIQHEGETIVLAAPDPAKVRRRRWIVNSITLVVCLAILYLAFRWLLD